MKNVPWQYQQMRHKKKKRKKHGGASLQTVSRCTDAHTNNLVGRIVLTIRTLDSDSESYARKDRQTEEHHQSRAKSTFLFHCVASRWGVYVLPKFFEGSSWFRRNVCPRIWRKHGSIHDLQYKYNGQYRNNLIFEASRREDLRRGLSGRRLWTMGRTMEKRYIPVIMEEDMNCKDDGEQESRPRVKRSWANAVVIRCLGIRSEQK